MTKLNSIPSSTIRRFLWLPAVLLIVVLGVAFGRPLYDYLTSQLTTKPDPGFVAPANHFTPYTVEQVEFDTPPLVPASISSSAAHALADKIDASIQPGFGGLKLYTSYITGHSYQDETGVVLNIPAVAPYPPAPPVPVYGSDPYKNKLLKDAYNKAVAAWKETVIQIEKQLPAIQQAVHLQTNKLRALSFPYNNWASDLLGGLADASDHFKNVPATVTKQLVIESDLINNVSSQELGTISLAGVSVSVVFFTCSDVATTCQARTSYLANLVKQAHGKSLQVFDVAQSQPFPVAV